MNLSKDISPRGVGERVIVAMSGGVDSSTTAKLLVDAGHDVVGLTMKLAVKTGAPNAVPEAVAPDQGVCCTTKDQEDAQRLAHQLGFDHHLLDFEADFDREVVTPFCRAYLEGKTPNPCVTCNRRLKFAALQRCRREMGYEYVATGHYARRAWDEERGRFLLLRGVDEKKDQSYFLYHLDQDTLAHMIFPLGGFTKDEIRDLASACGLEVADKPESQDICFVADGDYVSFIEQHEGATMEPGPIKNAQGETLGTHQGLARYTIGQRKGLCIAYSEPLFVLRKDVESNTLVVGTASEQGVHEIWADDVNLISCDDMPEYCACSVKANYRQKPVPAKVRVEREGATVLHVVLDEPMRSCAPGQSIVLYEGDVVIGGGTIARFA